MAKAIFYGIAGLIAFGVLIKLTESPEFTVILVVVGLCVWGAASKKKS